MSSPTSPPSTPPAVPYQAYKSKRHSRNVSNPGIVTPKSTGRAIAAGQSNATGQLTSNVHPPLSCPSNAPSNTHLHSEGLLNSNGTLTSHYAESPPQSISPLPAKFGSFALNTDTQTNMVDVPATSPMNPMNGQPTVRSVPSPVQSPSGFVNPVMLPSAQPFNGDKNVSQSRVVSSLSPRSSTPIQTPTALSTVLPPPLSPKDARHPQAHLATPSSSASNTSPISHSTITSPRKTSTFRRVPLRNTRPSETSALKRDYGRPRIASHSDSVTPSPVNSPRSSEKALPNTTTAKVFIPLPPPPPQERELPPPPIPDVQRQGSVGPVPVSSIRSGTSISSPPPLATPTRSSSTQSSRIQTPLPSRISAPYRPGFQPKGVYRPLTDEFIELRRQKREGDTSDGGSLKRIERTKLERRLEKLIALHFPPGELSHNPRPSLDNSRRSSLFFDLESLRSISIGGAVDRWKTVLASGIADSAKLDIRATEQRITPWQNDAEVSKCPMCTTSFHPLTNRKHHCRLCGKIVCSLPPKHPQRPIPCSLLFVVDSKTREIEEVGEGVDYGVKKRSEGQQKADDEDKFLRGVRICRDCRPVLRRQQHEQEIQRVPYFVNLYEAFLSLEKDIEDALPQFQELILSLSHNDQPTKEASAARKRLLEAFAQYDALSKEIRQIPCQNGPGSSQDRIQMAILTRASIFLQKNMFPLQSLPSTHSKKTSPKSGALESPETVHSEQAVLDPDSDLAQKIQPLLEQEALLESFIDEAKARRKFEDVKTLKANLREVRSEIERLLG